MRRTLLAPAALAGVLLAASQAWAPPPGRPVPPPPPPRPTPTPTPRPPAAPYRPPVTPARPPVVAPRPDFRAEMAAAHARSAAAAADLLRRQSVASLARAERAALLNLIAFQMLRQQQAVPLADLRRLRTDWFGVGSGAGLDPIIAMELEAAESAAERLLLADVLKLIADGQFDSADAKLVALDAPRYLPAVVTQALPELRSELKRTVPFAQMAAIHKRNGSYSEVVRPIAGVPEDRLPVAVARASRTWANLLAAHRMLTSDAPRAGEAAHTVEEMEVPLARVEEDLGPGLAGKLRAEMAGRLFLSGRRKDAAKLLDGAVDPVHAAAVLGDLRAIALGRGDISTPQIAAFVPADQTTTPASAVALLAPDQLANWKPPTRKPGETTVDAALAEAKTNLKAAVDVEVSVGTAKVTAAADRVRASVAAETGQLKAFLEKVEAARGRPFASPVERQLAAVAGTRGLTVAEAIGVLSAEADRPAAAARLLASVPAFADPVAFAVRVELSGRAPDVFKSFEGAGFTLAPTRDRARVRDATASVLDAHAARVAAGQPIDAPDRPALEVAVAKRLGLTSEALQPLEFVTALLDVCRDRADDHARLDAAARELDEVLADIEAGRFDAENSDVKDVFVLAKTRRLSVQEDRKRRAAAVASGCRLLGEYGHEAAPAAPWLRSQTEGENRPWRAGAKAALGTIDAK